MADYHGECAMCEFVCDDPTVLQQHYDDLHFAGSSDGGERYAYEAEDPKATQTGVGVSSPTAQETVSGRPLRVELDEWQQHVVVMCWMLFGELLEHVIRAFAPGIDSVSLELYAHDNVWRFRQMTRSAEEVKALLDREPRLWRMYDQLSGDNVFNGHMILLPREKTCVRWAIDDGYRADSESDLSELSSIPSAVTELDEDESSPDTTGWTPPSSPKKQFWWQIASEFFGNKLKEAVHEWVKPITWKVVPNHIEKREGVEEGEEEVSEKANWPDAYRPDPDYVPAPSKSGDTDTESDDDDDGLVDDLYLP